MAKIIMSNSTKLYKVISGGQTGADQGGLFAARAAGLRTGGWAPKGWMTDNGMHRELLMSYDMLEHESSLYRDRTIDNVKYSDGTLLIGNAMSPGSRLTMTQCKQRNKPVFHIHFNKTNPPNVETMVETFLVWLNDHKIEVLNVAGNREAKNPGIFGFTIDFLTFAFRGIQK
jgi:hypothetical protein